MSHSIRLRTATPADAPALLAIYAPYVRQTAITFEYEVPDEAEFARRIAGTLQNYPYLVVECDGAPVGYAYAGHYRSRTAYDWDAELSIYLAPDAQRHRLGTRLYRALLALLHAQNVVSAYACITQPGQSLAFHESLGFQKVGVFPRCGWKFECWHDVAWLEVALRQRVTAPEPFLPFPALPEETVKRALEGLL